MKMKRKNCGYRCPDTCPFESGEGTSGPVYALYKRGEMGNCNFFDPKYQCAHYPRLKNRPGRSLVDRFLGR